MREEPANQLAGQPTDAFSHVAEDYKYRDLYPDEIFHDILKFCNGRELAIDCATGTGQIPEYLSEYFKHVYGIDISEEQLKQAFPANNINYFIGKAEDVDLIPGIKTDSVDLITVGSAFHWLNEAEFFESARKLLKRGGTLAILDIGWPRIENDPALIAGFAGINLDKIAPEKQNSGIRNVQIPNFFQQINGLRDSYPISGTRQIQDIIGLIRSTSGFAEATKRGTAESIIEGLRLQLIRNLRRNKGKEFSIRNEAYLKAFKKIY